MREKFIKFLNITGGSILIIAAFALIIVMISNRDVVSEDSTFRNILIGVTLFLLLIGSITLRDGFKKKNIKRMDGNTIVSDSNIKANVSPPKDQIKSITGSRGTVAEFNSTTQQCRFWEGFSIKGRLFTYSDIVAYELLENGESVISGGLGRAVVGGLLLGWGGALVGGVTGTRTSREKCISLNVKITVNDMNKPTVFLNFVDRYSPVEKNSSKYEKIIKQAHECISALQLICERQNNEAYSPQIGGYELLTTQDAPYSGMIFLLKNGILQYITHPDVFIELQLDSNRIKNVSANAIKVHPRGDDIHTRSYHEEESKRVIDSSPAQESESAIVIPSSESQLTISTADEIRKFKVLLDEGAITAEEYETAKKSLLGM